MKKFIALGLIGISFLPATSRADMPVIDFATIAQLTQEFNELLKIWNEMNQARNDLDTLHTEALKWESFDFIQYRNGLLTLSGDIDKAKNIISDINSFNNLYPGYNSSAIQSYSAEFDNRSKALLNLLGGQISVANDALANQKDINKSDTSSAAAVANLTLASLSNLNSQISAEIRAANSYRANQVQNQIDQKTELQNFIGNPYKKHDPSKLKSCVGECS